MLKKAHKKSAFLAPETASLFLDTAYFGRDYGVMVLLDAVSKQALFIGEVTHESNALYLAAIAGTQEKGTVIQSMTGDGRKRFAQLLPAVPVQMCHFHQVQSINRYLTRSPKSVAARALVLNLKNSMPTSFKEGLAAWHTQHETCLSKRSTHPVTGRSHYTHKRLRSAYDSLQRNLDMLFTYERHPELCIPKTTNLLEGRFAELKRRLRCHQGMQRESRIRFIWDYFYSQQGKEQ